MRDGTGQSPCFSMREKSPWPGCRATLKDLEAFQLPVARHRPVSTQDPLPKWRKERHDPLPHLKPHRCPSSRSTCFSRQSPLSTPSSSLCFSSSTPSRSRSVAILSASKCVPRSLRIDQQLSRTYAQKSQLPVCSRTVLPAELVRQYLRSCSRSFNHGTRARTASVAEFTVGPLLPPPKRTVQKFAHAGSNRPSI